VPIDRAHRRLIGPAWMVRYPDSFVNVHNGLFMYSPLIFPYS